MADSPDLPGERAWRVGPDGRLPLEYWKFLRDLVTYVRQTQGNTTDLSAISARLDALEAASQSGVSGRASVQAIQQEAETVLQLVGDLVVPGLSRYYGTNPAGAKGWHELLLSALADVDLVTTPPADGDVLTWDDAAQKWVPGAAGGGGGSAEGGVLIEFGTPSDDSPVLPVGTKAQAIASASYELTGEWELWCYPSGSVQVDVWVDDFASLPPTDADSICPGDEPAVAASISATGSFTGPVTVNRTDGVTANIDSNSGVKWVSLLLKGTKTA